MNKNFWEFVKKLVIQHKSELKPCKFYEANKQYVNQEYKKKQVQVEYFRPGYQNFLKK